MSGPINVLIEARILGVSMVDIRAQKGRNEYLLFNSLV